MSDSRTKNTFRNMSFGLLNRIVSLALPFITRTIVLYFLGEKYLGIGTLFSSILNFLSLAELGVGSAIVYSMYEPISQNDYTAINALLKYYKHVYRKVGVVFLSIGTALLPAVPYLMNGDAPQNINVYILYYIYLINSVISYFFAGYRQCLLSANQRADITSKVGLVVNITVQLGQILILCVTKNFYAYAFVPIVGTIIINACNAIITRKKYPMCKCEGEVSEATKRDVRKKVSGLFGTKLNSIVIHSADVIVISTCLGLSLTAKYGNYYYILNAVCGLVATIFSSMTASIGNKLVRDSLEENYRLFKRISFVNTWAVGWSSCCFLCLYEPFIAIWVGENQQLGFAFTVLMAAYYYIYQIQKTILTFKDAAGLWYKDRYRPYVSMTINLVTNIILVNVMGVHGVVISTILAFCVSLPWINKVLFDELFHKPAYKNLLSLIRKAVLTVLVAAFTYGICLLGGDGVIGIVYRFVICLLVPNTLYFLAYYKCEEFKWLQGRIKQIVHKL